MEVNRWNIGKNEDSVIAINSHTIGGDKGERVFQMLFVKDYYTSGMAVLIIWTCG